MFALILNNFPIRSSSLSRLKPGAKARKSSSSIQNYCPMKQTPCWVNCWPLPKLRAAIVHDFDATDDEFAAIDARVKEEVDRAVAFAEAGSELPPSRLYEDVYVEL